MWFSFDMKESRELTGITLRCEASPADYPRSYTLEASHDGKQWKQVVSPQKGNSPVTDILLPATKTRFVRINQIGLADGKYWSIHQLEVYAKAE